MQKIKSLFVIDDDPEDIEMFIEAVGEVAPAINCSSSNNYNEAILKLQSNPLPEVIFLDLNMPGIDGKHCLSELKKDEKFSHIPVIIYTTSAATKDKNETIALGASHFITKPANYGRLCQLLSEVLSQEFILQITSKTRQESLISTSSLF